MKKEIDRIVSDLKMNFYFLAIVIIVGILSGF